MVGVFQLLYLIWKKYQKPRTRNQPETLHLTALFGVEMFQRTAHIVADSYSGRPLLLSLWMSAGPSEPEWPEGSTGSPAQRQFLRIFVSKSRFSQNLKKSWIHICLIYHLVIVSKNWNWIISSENNNKFHRKLAALLQNPIF